MRSCQDCGERDFVYRRCTRYLANSQEVFLCSECQKRRVLASLEAEAPKLTEYDEILEFGGKKFRVRCLYRTGGGCEDPKELLTRYVLEHMDLLKYCTPPARVEEGEDAYIEDLSVTREK